MMNDSSIDGCPRRTYYFDQIGELIEGCHRSSTRARPSRGRASTWPYGLFWREKRAILIRIVLNSYMNRLCRKWREEFRTDSYAYGCQFEKWRERFVLNSAVPNGGKPSYSTALIGVLISACFCLLYLLLTYCIDAYGCIHHGGSWSQ